MSLNREITHNTAIQFLGKIVGTIIALVATTFLFRYLGPTEYGKFHIILTFVQFAGVIADMGLYLIVLNDISLPGQDVSHVIRQNFLFRTYLNIAYLVMTALFVLFLPYESIIRLGILLMSVGNIFNWYTQIFQSLFQKNLTTYYSALGEILGRTALLVTTIVMIYFKAPLAVLTLTVVIGNAAAFLIGLFFGRTYLHFSTKIDKVYIKSVILRTWPITLSVWFSLIYFKADTIVLSFFRSNYEVGIYGMPYRILETLIGLPMLFMGLILPLLNHAYARGDMTRMRVYMQKAFDALSIMSIPLIFGSLVLGKSVVYLFAGVEFGDSIPILQILMIAVFIMFILAFFGHAVITVGRQHEMLKYYFAIAMLMLAGYLIFIPYYSYWAAAYLTVFGEFLTLVAAFYVVYKSTRFVPRLSRFCKSLISAILMAAAVYFIKDFSIFITLPISVLLYIFFLYATGAVRSEFVGEIMGLRN